MNNKIGEKIILDKCFRLKSNPQFHQQHRATKAAAMKKLDGSNLNSCRISSFLQFFYSIELY